MRMGSINAIVSSCATAAISPTGGDVQQRHAGPRRRQKGPSPVCPSLILKVGNRGDGNSLRLLLRFPALYGSEIQRQQEGTRGAEPGRGPGEDAAARGRHWRAGKPTTNSDACEPYSGRNEQR